MLGCRLLLLQHYSWCFWDQHNHCCPCLQLLLLPATAAAFDYNDPHNVGTIHDSVVEQHCSLGTAAALVAAATPCCVLTAAHFNLFPPLMVRTGDSSSCVYQGFWWRCHFSLAEDAALIYQGLSAALLAARQQVNKRTKLTEFDPWTIQTYRCIYRVGKRLHPNLNSPTAEKNKKKMNNLNNQDSKTEQKPENGTWWTFV